MYQRWKGPSLPLLSDGTRSIGIRQPTRQEEEMVLHCMIEKEKGRKREGGRVTLNIKQKGGRDTHAGKRERKPNHADRMCLVLLNFVI